MHEVLTAEERRWHAEWGHLNALAASNCETAGGVDVLDQQCRYYAGLLALRAANPAPDMRMHDLFATALQEGRTVTVFPGDEAAAVAAAWAIGLPSFEVRARPPDRPAKRTVEDLTAAIEGLVPGGPGITFTIPEPEHCPECSGGLYCPGVRTP